MNFSKGLKETRKRMKLSQEEMAKKLNVARSSLSLYEAGKQIPDLVFLDNLHKLSGAPFDYLMGYTDNYTPDTAGIDKSLGLSTETLEVLKNDFCVSTAINYLAKNGKLNEWAEAAIDFHDLGISEKRQRFLCMHLEENNEITSEERGRYFAECFVITKKRADLYMELGKIAGESFEPKEEDAFMRKKPIVIEEPDIFDLMNEMLKGVPEGLEKEQFLQRINAVMNGNEEESSHAEKETGCEP